MNLPATAYHEAGHAVLTLTQGLRVHDVTTIPAPGSHGRITHTSPLRGVRLEFDRSDRARIRAQRAIRICLAGPVAQRRYRASSWRQWHGASDHDSALGIALSVSASEREVQALLNLLTVQTEQAIELHWQMVEALGGALIERRRLSGREVHDIAARWLGVGLGVGPDAAEKTLPKQMLR